MTDQLRIKLDTGPLDAALKRLQGAASKQAQAKVVDAAEKIMTKAKQLTPVDTGALRSSGLVTAKGKGAELSFGGAASSYAIYVHENLRAAHPVGQAKFLETALNEWQSGGGPQALGREIGKTLEGAA